MSSFEYRLRILTLLISRPLEALDRIRGRRELSLQTPDDPGAFPIEEEWRARLHHLVGAGWPCDCRSHFLSLWEPLREELEGSGEEVGFGHDSDPALAETLWTVAHHLKPSVAVETGVARGVSSRMILSALEENRKGRLYSIDLPPVMDFWRQNARAAVPARLRERWRYTRGSSRRRLPGLLREVRGVDLFCHDSLHTDATVRFELEQVWPVLRPGGVILVDDVMTNRGFGRFVRSLPERQWFVARERSEKGFFGFISKPA